MAGVHPCAVHTSMHVEKPNANHTVDLWREGSLSHACNTMAFILKGSNYFFVN